MLAGTSFMLTGLRFFWILRVFLELSNYVVLVSQGVHICYNVVCCRVLYLKLGFGCRGFEGNLVVQCLIRKHLCFLKNFVEQVIIEGYLRH